MPPNEKIQPQINDFYSAKCTPEALAKMQEIRMAFVTLDTFLKDLGPEVIVGAREMALAKTNLEQSAMWAIKAVSHYNVAADNNAS